MLIFCWCLKLRPGWPARPQGQYWLIIDLKLMLIFCWCLKLWLVTFPNISERPKGPFSLTAATVIRPQELNLIAVVTWRQENCGRKGVLRPKEGLSAVRESFGRKRIAAERVYCGRKGSFRPQYNRICSRKLVSLKFPPKGYIAAERVYFGRKRPYGSITVRGRLLRPQP